MSAEAIVFSKDRPLQLDGFLRSLERWAPGLYEHVYVIYRADSDEMEEAYWDVEAATPDEDRFEFVPDGSAFHDELLATVDDVETPLLGFHCDDDLWYASPELVEPVKDVTAFVPRLSPVSDFCQTAGRPMRAPGSTTWEWREQDPALDLGYPFALNGHVYQTSLVRFLLDRVGGFDGPNDLEHRMNAALCATTPEDGGVLLAVNEWQSLVSNPVNRVQDGYPNPCDGRPEWSPGALLERWQAGERLAVDQMDYAGIRSGHAVVPLVFEARPC